MPELNQLFLIDGVGRDVAELRDTLIRHRVFDVAIAADRDDLAQTATDLGFRVTRPAGNREFVSAVWDLRGSRALLVSDSRTLEDVRLAARARALPVVEI